jgi:DNA polymerase III sliding clamp (beta) subunit (PCNA family)
MSTSPMFLTKANLAVTKAASTDGSRYAISNVLIEADGATVATDGHMLVKVGALPANALATPLLPSIVPAVALATVAKALPKKGEHAIVDVDATNANGHFAIAAGTAVHAITKGEGGATTFPDYGRVYPTYDAPTLTIGFSVDLLSRMLDIAKAAGVKTLALNFGDDGTPLHATGETESGQTFSALAMPYRLK